ncbi:hypothetical protein [Mesobacillus foraminis]|uniref:Uncharacterized protein n=1 Tax=Mesobacillus foraminis TaxID=279826 RepID=A0A4R2BC49_9BACI|nr:hypothetical protein [Mesobacillus foraminis]TCN23109.1 hypothetical protein EV146_109269 [Mesobacillus foraminis]
MERGKGAKLARSAPGDFRNLTPLDTVISTELKIKARSDFPGRTNGLFSYWF